jgi:hypothetical protein
MVTSEEWDDRTGLSAPERRPAVPVACTRYRYGLWRLYGTDGDSATARLAIQRLAS